MPSKAEDMICTAIKCSTIEEMKKLAISAPTSIIELRIDTLKKHYNLVDEIRQLLQKLHDQGKKTIITLRDRDEGGYYTGSSNEKLKMLLELASTNPDFIDVELAFPRLNTLIRELANMKVKVILSYHNLSYTPEYSILKSLVGHGISLGAHIVKVVTLARNVQDNITVLNLCSEWKGKVISFCMGRPGLISRILAPFFGAPFTYAHHVHGKPTALGQISVKELIKLWKKLNLI